MWNAKEIFQIGILIADIVIAFLLVEAMEFLVVKAINRLSGERK